MKKILKIFAAIIWILIVVLALAFLWLVNRPEPKVAEASQMLTKMPLEEQFFGTGQYIVAKDQPKSFNKNKYLVFFPEELKTSNQKFPLIIAVNGTGVPAKKYQNILKHLASWGFIVVGNDEEFSHFGAGASETLQYFEFFNNNPESIFFQKIDLEKIGIFGHSQWWVGTINALTNFKNSSKIDSAFVLSPAELKLSNALGWDYNEAEISIPIFYLAGAWKVDAETITPLTSLEKHFANTQKSPFVWMARHKFADHGDVQIKSIAYITAWFLWTLNNDQNAGKIFEDKNWEIFSNENYIDVKIKIPE